MSNFTAMTAFRKIIAIFLLIGIVTNCFNQWLLFSSYSLNKSYIASVLCTNLNKPEMHCDGKCFLDIKLKELEQKNKQDQENLKRIVENISPTNANISAPLFEIKIKIEIPPYLQQKPIRNAVTIFHPPQQA